MIPAELLERDQWVVWRLEERDGTTTKVPYQAARPRSLASTTDPATWGKFEAASVVASNDKFDGIGYVFSPDDPYFGLDLDESLSEADKGAIMNALDTYAERSVSGNGYHVIGRGSLSGNGRHPHGLGVFDRSRYFVMTGEHVQGTPATIEERQAQLDQVLAEFLPQRQAVAIARAPVGLDDQELLERARTARNGADFERLWSGDTSGYASRSEADLALCSMLAFWTGPDAAALDRLFRSSGLMREKWQRPDYRARTIEKALSGRSEYFEPHREFDSPSKGVDDGRNERKLPFAPLAIALANVPAEPPWTWDGYLAPGAITLLAGRPKVGKSTLVFGLFEAILAARTFLEHTTRAQGILLLSEERESTLAEKARRFGLEGNLHLLMRHQVNGEPWEEIMAAATAYCLAHELGVLAIDTWDKWTGIKGDAENSAGSVIEALDPIVQAAGAGLCVPVVAHQRKSLGDFGEAVRGSNALTGGVDIVVEIERPRSDVLAGDGVRVLNAVSRFAATPEELVIALTEDGYEARGDTLEAKADAESAQVQAAIEALGEATAAQISEETGIPKASVHRHAQRLCEGQNAPISRSGRGKRGSPFVFRPSVQLLLDESNSEADDGLF
jgi:putative DNA primase/helicase